MLKVNKNKNTRTMSFLVSLLITLNIFHTLFQCSIANFEQVNTSLKGGDSFSKCHNKSRRILDSTKICSEVPFKKTLYHIEISQLSIDLLCKYGFYVIQVFTETYF